MDNVGITIYITSVAEYRQIDPKNVPNDYISLHTRPFGFGHGAAARGAKAEFKALQDANII